jgi:hypothetical protein
MITPLYLASLILIKQAFNLFSNRGLPTSGMLSTLAIHLSTAHDVYEIENIQNRIVDGTEPFPENQQSLAGGISVEFRLVVIRYFIESFPMYVCQKCFVPLPWCRQSCSAGCIVQYWGWPALREFLHFCGAT